MARKRLLEAGHREVPADDAELQVVNTCCITSEAEAKSRQSVRRALRKSPGSRVLVTGCAANLEAEQFDLIAPEVTVLKGIADDVAGEVASIAGLGCIDTGNDTSLMRPLGKVRTRGFVKVQDGCDGRCAYCVIPKVRGEARSRSAGAVLDEVGERVEQGQPEMVITGISVGDYRDPSSGWDLGRLMREIAKVDGVERVRLSSVEVSHVNRSLMDALVDEPKVCAHLHIPLQSGDDGVLEAMGRSYKTSEYLSTIELLRIEVPGINITTDAIVGFPNEDEPAFRRSLSCVGEAGVTKVHTFSFSSRPGTEAAYLGDPVPPQVKKDRSKRMRSLSEVQGWRYRAGTLGSTVAVLVDKEGNSRVSGYTEDYIRVHLEPGKAHSGQILDVKLEELCADGILGVPV